MRPSNSRAVNYLLFILRLSLCLIVVVITIIGAADRAAAASAPVGLPEIRMLSADPTTLPDGSHALYTFVVSGATSMKMIEAGAIIKEITGPPDVTLKGTIKGRSTYEIRTSGMNTFDTVLVAVNARGKQEKTLSLAFATKSVLPTTTPPDGTTATDNKTTIRKFMSEWGPMTYAPVSSSSPTAPATLPEESSATAPNEPNFFKCPSTCQSCLTPDDAAAKGLTNKCSDQPCYFSPNRNKNWYCYSEPVGYCCKQGEAGLAGQVTGPITKTQCTQTGGDYWSTDKDEALQSCQPTGYCCRNGQVAGPMSKADCAAAGGSLWSTKQYEVMQACQPLGYCCRNNQIVGPLTQAQATQMELTWYATQYEAQQACQPIGWCCRNGQLTQSTQAQCSSGFAAAGTWYANATEAQRACLPTYWCCSNGQVYQTSIYSTGCYNTQAEAVQACSACWCCSGGKVYQTTPAACSRAGGSCYSSQSQASSACLKYRTQ